MTLFWIGLSVGITCGLIIAALLTKIVTTVGKLIIDQTNAEKDIYKIELDDLDHLDKMRYIVLKVENRNS